MRMMDTRSCRRTNDSLHFESCLGGADLMASHVRAYRSRSLWFAVVTRHRCAIAPAGCCDLEKINRREPSGPARAIERSGGMCRGQQPGSDDERDGQ
jgi:hypothetical protein